MKKEHSARFYILRFLICAALACGAFFYAFTLRRLNLAYTPSETAESSTLLSNPYCGFYKISGYTLSDDHSEADASQWSKKACKDDPYPLILLEINLKNYSNMDLSSTALQQLNRILTECSKAGKQLILRFLYDWDGKARETEPTDFFRIKNHISQLGPVVNKYTDSVYIIQGLLIGNNGEMHDSNYENIDQIRQLAEAMAAAVSPEIYLAVRTPAQLRGILRTKTPLASSQTGDGSLASRLGLFNDGMLASVYDLGTYDDTPLTSSSTPGEKGSRSDELIYQYKLCQYVPNGGEVTVDNEYNNLENAIADLATMHVSYLNAEHDPEVLSKWKNSVYTGSDIFSGVNGFDYMSAHLGYRYRLKTSSLAFRSLLDDTARLYLTIENTGFSSAYRTFETTLVLKNENTGESEDLETNIDNTSIAGNDESIFRLELDVRSLKKGTYTLELKMTDPATKTVIHFANTGYETSDTIPVGTFTLS